MSTTRFMILTEGANTNRALTLTSPWQAYLQVTSQTRESKRARIVYYTTKRDNKLVHSSRGLGDSERTIDLQTSSVIYFAKNKDKIIDAFDNGPVHTFNAQSPVVVYRRNYRFGVPGNISKFLIQPHRNAFKMLKGIPAYFRGGIKEVPSNMKLATDLFYEYSDDLADSGSGYYVLVASMTHCNTNHDKAVWRASGFTTRQLRAILGR